MNTILKKKTASEIQMTPNWGSPQKENDSKYEDDLRILDKPINVNDPKEEENEVHDDQVFCAKWVG